MKIVIISPSLDPEKNVSGISSVVDTIMRHGNNEYIHFTFGSTDKTKGKKNLKWIINLIKSFIKFSRLLRRTKPDLVHMNIPCDNNGIIREFIISKISRIHKAKIIAHLHGGIYLTQKNKSSVINYLFKSILNNVLKVIVLSDIEKENLNKFYQYSSAIVLQNSIDSKLYYKKTKLRNNPLITILYLGRIDYNKGLTEITEALKYLKEEYNFRFVICGDGPEKLNFLNDCNDILGDRLIYYGIVSGQRKLEILSGSDIYILPSYFEGLPVSLLEAMASGCVPVVTAVGSIPKVVLNNENGLIIDKHNSNDLLEKIKLLISSPDLLEKLSMNARNYIQKHYDVEKMIITLEQIYKESF